MEIDDTKSQTENSFQGTILAHDYHMYRYPHRSSSLTEYLHILRAARRQKGGDKLNLRKESVQDVDLQLFLRQENDSRVWKIKYGEKIQRYTAILLIRSSSSKIGHGYYDDDARNWNRVGFSCTPRREIDHTSLKFIKVLPKTLDRSRLNFLSGMAERKKLNVSRVLGDAAKYDRPNKCLMDGRSTEATFNLWENSHKSIPKHFIVQLSETRPSKDCAGPTRVKETLECTSWSKLWATSSCGMQFYSI